MPSPLHASPCPPGATRGHRAHRSTRRGVLAGASTRRKEKECDTGERGWGAPAIGVLPSLGCSCFWGAPGPGVLPLLGAWPSCDPPLVPQDCAQGTARCLAFRCPLHSFERAAVLTARGRLWNSTFLEVRREWGRGRGQGWGQGQALSRAPAAGVPGCHLGGADRACQRLGDLVHQEPGAEGRLHAGLTPTTPGTRRPPRHPLTHAAVPRSLSPSTWTPGWRWLAACPGGSSSWPCWPASSSWPCWSSSSGR